MESYIYSNISDFTNATIIVLSELQDDINNSSIASANVQYSVESGDNIEIFFDGVLSIADQSTLTELVNSYTSGIPEEVITNNGDFQLSNKDLFTNNNFFIDPTITTKRLGFNTSGATGGTTLTLESICTTDRTITFPDINDTVVTLNEAQTLTNKNMYNTIFNGQGNTSSDYSPVYINPSSTIVENSSDYYFTYLATPTTTGSTLGSAYTLYIEDAPTGTITNPYAFYISSGKSHFGGDIEIPTGASDGFVLTSDANGIATWQTPPTISTFENDVEINSAEELRCNNITATDPLLPLTITSSEVNLNGNLSNLGQPHILLRKTIDQSLPVLTTTDIDYDTIISNSLITKLLPSNSEFTLNSTGVFLMTGEIWMEGASTTYEAWFTHSTAVNYRYGFTRLTSSNTDIKFTISTVILVNDPNSTVKLSCTHSADVPLTFRGPSQFRAGEMSIVKLF